MLITVFILTKKDNNHMIKVGIVGGAGYTAGELIRILLGHPDAELVFVNSASNAGNSICSVHSGLVGDIDLTFTDGLPLESVDVLFLCTAHGDSRRFIQEHPLPGNLKVIDLSQDYRLAEEDNDFIYGLPELNRRAICKSTRVANPGCFATAIQLALLPLARHRLLDGDINVNAITGSTGAGVKPQPTSHFSWRTDNISVYKPFVHQHLAEIRQSLSQLQPDFGSEIFFVPYRGNFARGIFCSVMVRNNVPEEVLYQLYREYYERDSFVHVTEDPIDLKQVVNTNKCLVHLDCYRDRLLVTTCIDNLLKGASGTAVHNMNLLFNLKETVGLSLKPSAF